jgi:hypothetical protein
MAIPTNNRREFLKSCAKVVAFLSVMPFLDMFDMHKKKNSTGLPLHKARHYEKLAG